MFYLCDVNLTSEMYCKRFQHIWMISLRYSDLEDFELSTFQKFF